MSMIVRPFRATALTVKDSALRDSDLVAAMVLLGVCAASPNGRFEGELLTIADVIDRGLNLVVGHRDEHWRVQELVTAGIETVHSCGTSVAAQLALDRVVRFDSFRNDALKLIAVVLANDTEFDPDAGEWNFFDDCSEALHVDGEVAAEVWNDVLDLYFDNIASAR